MTPDTASPDTPSAAPVRYKGEVAGLSANIVHGWALDTHEPDARVVIEILLDGHPVGVCIANQQQTAGDGSGDQLHGFSLALTESALREASTVSARVANQPDMLGAPWRIGHDKGDVPTVGTSQLWYGGGLVLSGWLWDPQQPGRQLTAIAREGNRVVARAPATRPHPALVQMPSAEHGFMLELPWALADGKPHEIHVSDDSGKPLAGSPVIVCCQPEGVSGLLPRLWPKGKDKQPVSPEALESLVRLAQSQERFAPPSIGFSQYPEWFALHARQLAAKPANKHDARVVLLVGPGEPQAVEASLASAGKQRHRGTTAQAVQDTDLRGGIVAAIGDGAELVVPLSAGDWLAPEYVDHVLEVMAQGDAAWVFTDCDQDGPAGGRTNPWLKPSWDPDLFLGLDIVTPGSAWKAGLLRDALAHFPDAMLPDWPSVSVLIAHYLHATGAPESRVARQVGVLYHRAAHAPAQPYDAPRSPTCTGLLRRFVRDMAPGAVVKPVPEHPNILRVTWPLPENPPLVSLIVPTRDQFKLLSACVEGLLTQTDYPNLEVIVVDNHSSDPDTLAYMTGLETRGVRVLRYPHPFNYSAINNFAVEHARGEVIGLINNDIEVITATWLTEMVSQLWRPNVAAVGAKLIWRNGMVQHAGVVIGIDGVAAHVGNDLHRDDPGYIGLNQATHSRSAATAACLLVRKADYLRAGGLDETYFSVAFNDVDLCLKLRATNQRISIMTGTVLYHVESASRGKDLTTEQRKRSARERSSFISRWGKTHAVDDFYSPSLSTSYLTGPYSALALMPLPRRY